jgi:hypothetical protein
MSKKRSMDIVGKRPNNVAESSKARIGRAAALN